MFLAPAHDDPGRPRPDLGEGVGAEMRTEMSGVALREYPALARWVEVPWGHHHVTTVNRGEIVRVLERAALEPAFIADVSNRGSSALDGYRLTMAEKAALVSGDIRWLEERIGRLTERQACLLTCMLQREAW